MLAAVVVEGGTGGHGDVGKGAVVIVVVEDAGGAVTGNIDVGPAIVVVVKGGNAEGVMPVGLIDVSFGGDVFKFAGAEIAIKDIFRPGQSARPAHDRNAFPHAGGPFSRREGRGGIIIDVIRNQ